MKHVEVRLAGEGGQGVILAAVILAEAAAVFDGYTVVQTQSYGPESRGGASKSEVIIADGEIEYPRVQSPDVLLIMSQEAADKYTQGLKPSAVLIIDSTMVKDVPVSDARVLRLPITEVARETLGREIVANIVGLGALVGLTNLVGREALASAVLDRVPKGTEDLNKRALEAGFELAKNAG